MASKTTAPDVSRKLGNAKMEAPAISLRIPAWLTRPGNTTWSPSFIFLAYAIKRRRKGPSPTRRSSTLLCFFATRSKAFNKSNAPFLCSNLPANRIFTLVWFGSAKAGAKSSTLTPTSIMKSRQSPSLPEISFRVSRFANRTRELRRRTARNNGLRAEI